MIALNDDQAAAVDFPDSIVVTACPGSGKTRVLTQRVARALEGVEPRRRVVAMTFTNRATDEIKHRLDHLGVDQTHLWAGTIHSFALEWLLRPYAPYLERLRNGFSVIDEFASDRLIRDLKATHRVGRNEDIPTRRNRDGLRSCPSAGIQRVLEDYDEKLRQQRSVDYDDVLYLAYELLTANPEICDTLARIIAWFCIDEIQDIQDLQYAMLGCIVRASDGTTRVFCVGDQDQAIYESLGAIVKTPDEIAAEFGLSELESRSLAGNYRSTQRIIDFYRAFRPGGPPITAYADYAGEPGRITFWDQSCTAKDLPPIISECIQECLGDGVEQQEICVLAPQWWHVRSIGRALVKLLPDVNFDAPGLSPLHAQRESTWFKVARLFLTKPHPSTYGTRMRWAWEVLRDLEDIHDISCVDVMGGARGLLRFVNSTRCDEVDGLRYLREVFSRLLDRCGVALSAHRSLNEAYGIFFEKAENRIASLGTDAIFEVAAFEKLI